MGALIIWRPPTLRALVGSRPRRRLCCTGRGVAGTRRPPASSGGVEGLRAPAGAPLTALLRGLLAAQGRTRPGGACGRQVAPVRVAPARPAVRAAGAAAQLEAAAWEAPAGSSCPPSPASCGSCSSRRACPTRSRTRRRPPLTARPRHRSPGPRRRRLRARAAVSGAGHAGAGGQAQAADGQRLLMGALIIWRPPTLRALVGSRPRRRLCCTGRGWRGHGGRLQAAAGWRAFARLQARR